MNTAYLCLGGNMGDREKHLLDALSLIRARAGTTGACSAFYETEAWGVDRQAAYLNVCVALHTGMEAPQLMSELLTIEKMLGRERTGLQYAARTVDIDILFFNQSTIASSLLTVPHPRLHLRRFVLVPLAEIAAGLVHPVFHKTVAALLEACTDRSEVTHYKKTPCISA